MILGSLEKRADDYSLVVQYFVVKERQRWEVLT